MPLVDELERVSYRCVVVDERRHDRPEELLAASCRNSGSVGLDHRRPDEPALAVVVLAAGDDRRLPPDACASSIAVLLRRERARRR